MPPLRSPKSVFQKRNRGCYLDGTCNLKQGKMVCHLWRCSFQPLKGGQLFGHQDSGHLLGGLGWRISAFLVFYINLETCLIRSKTLSSSRVWGWLELEESSPGIVYSVKGLGFGLEFGKKNYHCRSKYFFWKNSLSRPLIFFFRNHIYHKNGQFHKWF